MKLRRPVLWRADNFTLLRKFAFLLIGLWLATSLACRLPAFLEKSPAQGVTTDQPAAGATAVKTSAPLAAFAPGLVETMPARNGELTAAEGLTLYFNQPMDVASVETALKFEPALDGRFEWSSDHATVRFFPADPLPSGSEVFMTLAAGARSTSGGATSESVTLQFRLPQPLRVIEQAPAPLSQDADPAAPVLIAFNQPMLPLGKADSDEPQAITLDPAVSGRGEWLNTSTYVLYPDPPLASGTVYTVTLNSTLVSAAGMPLLANEQPMTWSFTTATASVVDVSPDPEVRIGLDESLKIRFNQPMNPTSTEKAVSIFDSAGNKLKGTYSWDLRSKTLTFTPDELLARSAAYRLSITAEAQTQGGSRLAQPVEKTFSTVSNLAVVRTDPPAGQELDARNGYATYVIEMSQPLAKMNLRSVVQVEPEVDNLSISLAFDRRTLSISGSFHPATTYSVTFSPDLHDRWSGGFSRDPAISFKTGSLPPELTIPVLSEGNPVVFTTRRDQAIAAMVANLSRVYVTIERLTTEGFFELLPEADEGTLPIIEQPTGGWNVHFEPAPDRRTRVQIPLAQPGGELAPGYYLFQVESPELAREGASGRTSFLVVCGSVSLTMKRSPGEIFVWAVDLVTNEPVAQEQIYLYDDLRHQVGAVGTDAQGTGRITLPQDSIERHYTAIIGAPEDERFGIGMDRWTNRVSGNDFGYSMQTADNQAFAYLYTDRPTYNPGQTVYFRAIVREIDDGRYALPQTRTFTAQVLVATPGPRNEQATLASLSMELSSYGTATGSFTLPESAKSGTYTLALEEVEGAQVHFEVAGDQKSDIELSIDFDRSEVLASDQVNASVTARYPYGPPAANLALQWRLFAGPQPAALPGGYLTGKVISPWQKASQGKPGASLVTTLATGTGSTGEDGRLQIPIDLDELATNLPSEETLSLILEVETQAGDTPSMTARSSITVYPAATFIGVRPETRMGAAGSPLGFFIQTVDWALKPVASQNLSAEFQKVIDPESGLSFSDALHQDYEPVGSAGFETDAGGQARLAFTPPEPGLYRLQIKGGGAVTEVLSWVAGEGAPTWPKWPAQHVSLLSDAESYKPGQTAKIFIPNPLEGRSLALVSVERGKVLRSDVVHLEGAGLEYELPVCAEDAPNVFISVTIIGIDDDGKHDFRQGYLEVQVAPEAFSLKVEVTPEPAHTRPGSPVNIHILMKDFAGRPVQGEFSLAVVDKDTLSLTGPNGSAILDALYGKQPLGVTNSLSMAASGQRFFTPPASEGDTRENTSLATQKHGRLIDTAYWNGKFETDANGQANLELTLPEELTTWVALVRGLTRDTLVGETVVEIVAGKDLLVRPDLPKFLVSGDHTRLGATVINNTLQELEVDVAFQAQGFTLDNNAVPVQSIVIPAHSGRPVTWWGIVQNEAAIDLLISARAGELEDTFRPAGGALPVLRYAAPTTFASSGFLAESDVKEEIIQLPRSFSPEAGQLTLELSPSLAAVIIASLKSVETYPTDLTEAQLSRLLPKVETYRALATLGLDAPGLRPDLEKSIQEGLEVLLSRQNPDGGWGWTPGDESDLLVSAYALYGLSRAAGAGFDVNPRHIGVSQAYLAANLPPLENLSNTAEFDRLAFEYFALRQSGNRDIIPGLLFDFRDRMNPWAKSLLALAMANDNPADERTRELLEQIKTSTVKSPNGAYWGDDVRSADSMSSPVFSTALATLALAQLDPASPIMNEAVHYLVSSRQPNGGWNSSYETAWCLHALTAALQGTGDLQSRFSFIAKVNGTILAEGQAEGPNRLTPVEATVPIDSLYPDRPNILQIERDAGGGRLYYRAGLEVFRPVESAAPVQKGMIVTRSYALAGQDCTGSCPKIDTVQLSAQPQWVEVRLTLTTTENMFDVALEDFIPAGGEIINEGLNNSPAEGHRLSSIMLPGTTREDPAGGWFAPPRIFDDHIRWVARRLPAGTYQLVYHFLPVHAGEYRILPAHAYRVYFPEVEGASEGSLFKIAPQAE